jgi:hypothetical protein
VTLNVQVPQIGLSNSTEDVKITNTLTALATWANGGIATSDISAAFAQAATVNQAGQTVKGAVNTSTSQSTSSTSYTTLSTPDQVTGITLAANGLIRVWFVAQWQGSVAGAASAVLVLGANQVLADGGGGVPSATTGSATPT